jgi:prevent-host-death family protein
MDSPPRTVGSRELKTRLGAYLRQVRSGITLIVTDRGVPVAELRPLGMASVELGEALGELIARGVLGGELRERPPLGGFDPVECKGEPASRAVIEDREDRF